MDAVTRRVNKSGMKIYTKTGDTGKTSLFGGACVSKGDLPIEAVGAIDELSCQLGLTREFVKTAESQALLHSIQRELYEIMAVVAGRDKPVVLLDESIQSFEQEVDKMTSELPELHSFIMPGGGQAAALLHISRAVCRRAERSLVRLSEASKNSAELAAPIKYLNRLSDLLFTLARYHAIGEDMHLVQKTDK